MRSPPRANAATSDASPSTPAWSSRRLPPTFVVAAELDILHDQSLLLAVRLQEADVAVDVLDVPGVTHGFLAYGQILPQARETLAAACDWCRRTT